MKICFICVEYFGWGKYGGFGRVARIVSRELVRKGHEVSAIVPRREDQRPIEIMEGVKVYSFRRAFFLDILRLARQCNADIYHSEEASLGTFLAKKAMPHKKHIVSFQDPKFLSDFYAEFRSPSLNKMLTLAAYVYENNWLVKQAVRHTDGVFYRVHFIREKTKKVFKLQEKPQFLPVPVQVKLSAIAKSLTPTVCSVGRWDRRKRPHLFLELAKKYPHVRFVAVGQSQDVQYDTFLRAKYGDLPNLTMPGFVDQFSSDTLSEVLGQSWVLVNTSTREGLPNAFLEALAHKCSILSGVNPEDVASRFGYHAKTDNFEQGLMYLLERDTWREKGEAGYNYVLKNYEMDAAINKHIEIYNKIMR